MTERVRLRLPVAANYRGKPVGVWLGVALGAATILYLIVLAGLAAWVQDGSPSVRPGRLVAMAGGCTAILLVGLYDDLRPAQTRGLLSQVRALLGGQITSGVIKLAVIAAASAFVALALGGPPGRRVLGFAVMAGSANLWNLLDVAPGRALKFFLPATVALGVAAWAGGSEYGALASMATGAGLVALVIDVRERAMLGDSGSNVLGFIVGIGAFLELATWALAVTLAAIVALHVVSETVTLSRVIRGVPPLRWFDGLGRIPPAPLQVPGAEQDR